MHSFCSPCKLIQYCSFNQYRYIVQFLLAFLFSFITSYTPAYSHANPAANQITWYLSVIQSGSHNVVFNRKKIKNDNQRSSISFLNSSIPWKITACTIDKPETRAKNKATDTDSRLLNLGTKKSGAYLLTTYTPEIADVGFIEIDTPIIPECSNIEIDGKSYVLAQANQVTQISHNQIADQTIPLKISLNIAVDKGNPPSIGSGGQSGSGTGNDDGGGGCCDDYDDLFKGRRPPPPIAIPLTDKEESVNAMLNYLSSILSTPYIQQWYRNLITDLSSRYFPQQALDFANEKLASFFLSIFTIFSGNYSQLKNSIADENLKTEPTLVYKTTKDGKRKAFLQIITKKTDGSEVENIVPAYLVRWNDADNAYHEITYETIEKFFNIFDTKQRSVGQEQEHDLLLNLIVNTLLKNVYWVTDLPSLKHIPLSKKHIDIIYDNYAHGIEGYDNTAKASSPTANPSTYLRQLELTFNGRAELNIPMDGQCFFRSLGYVLHGKQITDNEVLVLRKQLANHLQGIIQNHGNARGSQPLHIRDKELLAEYLSNLNDLQQWGEAELIPLAAERFQQDIYFVTANARGEPEFAMADREGNVRHVEKIDDIKNATYVIYHDGNNHWGVSHLDDKPSNPASEASTLISDTATSTTSQEDLTGSSGKYPEHHNFISHPIGEQIKEIPSDPAEGTNNKTAGSTTASTSQSTHGDTGASSDGGAKGQNPSPSGSGNAGAGGGPPGGGPSLLSQASGRSSQQDFDRLNDIEEVDIELVNDIQGLSSLLQDDNYKYLQEYVTSITNIFDNCQDDLNVSSSNECAADLQWLISENKAMLKELTKILKKRTTDQKRRPYSVSENRHDADNWKQRQETALKIMALSNLVSSKMTIRSIRVFIVFILVDKHTDTADYDDRTDEDTNKLLADNRILIRQLFEYLYENRGAFKQYAIKAFNSNLTRFHLQDLFDDAKDFSNQEPSQDHNELLETATIIDNWFKEITRHINPSVKKIRKMIIIEEGNTQPLHEQLTLGGRNVREYLELMTYSFVLLSMLSKFKLSKKADGADAWQNYLKKLVEDIKDFTKDPRKIPEKHRDAALSAHIKKMERIEQHFKELIQSKDPQGDILGGDPDVKVNALLDATIKVDLRMYSEQLEETFFFVYSKTLGVRDDFISKVYKESYGIALLAKIHQSLLDIIDQEKLKSLEETHKAHRSLWGFMIDEVKGFDWNAFPSEQSTEWDTKGTDTKIRVYKRIQNTIAMVKVHQKLLRANSYLGNHLKNAKHEELKLKLTQDLMQQLWLDNARPSMEVIEDVLTNTNNNLENEYGSFSFEEGESFIRTFLPHAQNELPRDFELKEYHLTLIHFLLLQNATKKEKGKQPVSVKSLDESLTRDEAFPSYIGKVIVKMGKKVANWLMAPEYKQGKKEFQLLTYESLETIKPSIWNQGSTWMFPGNYIHDQHCLHDKKGCMRRPAPYIDTAIATVESIRRLYSLLINTMANVKHNFQYVEQHKSHPMLAAESIELKGATSCAIKLIELINDKMSLLEVFITNKASQLEKGRNLILEILLEGVNQLNENKQVDWNIINDAMTTQKNNIFKKSVQVLDEKSRDNPVHIQEYEAVQLTSDTLSFMKFFLYSILIEITDESFRFKVTADKASVTIMTELLTALHLRVRLDGGPEQPLYTALRISQETVEVIENYYHRLCSEHYSKLSQLLAEKLYLISSKEANELTVGADKQLKMLKTHLIVTNRFKPFLQQVVKNIKPEQPRDNQPNIDESNPIEVEVETAEAETQSLSYDMLLKNLKSGVTTTLKKLEEKQTRLQTQNNGVDNDDVVLVVDSDNQLEPLMSGASPEIIESELDIPAELAKTAEEIKIGEMIEKYVEVLIHNEVHQKSQSNYVASREEIAARKSCWSKVTKILEEHESKLTSVYFAMLLQTLYYHALGIPNPKYRYKSGAQAPFATLPIESFISVEVSTLVTSMFSVFMTASLSSAWQNDISSQIAIAIKTRELFFACSTPSSTFIDQCIIIYLNSKRAGRPLTVTESLKQNPYRSCTNLKDTFGDIASYLCCRTSPLNSNCATPGCLNYCGRAMTCGMRGVAADRVRGGTNKLHEAHILSLNRRVSSTLVRLLGENSFKGSNNAWGISLWQQIVALGVHLLDAPIAAEEMIAFTDCQIKSLELFAGASAEENLFEGRKLDQFDKDQIISMFGRAAAEILFETAKPSSNPTDEDNAIRLENIDAQPDVIDAQPDVIDNQHDVMEDHYKSCQRWKTAYSACSVCTQTVSSGVACLDISYYIIAPLKGIKWAVKGVCNAAKAKFMPNLGKENWECAAAQFAENRDKKPILRAAFVATNKVGTLAATTATYKAAALDKGYVVVNELTLGYLISGLVKNGFMGPLERGLQLGSNIGMLTLAEISGNLDSGAKEAIDSIIQRLCPKAPLSFKQAASTMVMNIFKNANGDISNIHMMIEEQARHLENNVGLSAMNSIAETRSLIATEKLHEVPLANEENQDPKTFAFYRDKVHKKLAETMPSFGKHGIELDHEHVKPYDDFQEMVKRFIYDIEQGKLLITSAINFLKGVASMDPKIFIAVVDIYFYEMMHPEKSTTDNPSGTKDGYIREDEPFWPKTIRKYKIMKEKQLVNRPLLFRYSDQ